MGDKAPKRAPAAVLWVGIAALAAAGWLAPPGTAAAADGEPASAGAASAQPSLTLDLDGCIERALSHSPELAIADRAVDVAGARLTEAQRIKWLPELELTNLTSLAPTLNIAPGGPFDLDTRDDWRNLTVFNRLSVEFLQPLYTFGRLRNLERAAAMGLDARRAARDHAAQRTVFRTSYLYYSRVLAHELRRIAADARGVANKVEKRIAKALDEGDPEVKQADLYKVRLFRHDIVERTAQIRTTADLSIKALKALLGMGKDQALELGDRFLDPVGEAAHEVTHYQQTAAVQRGDLAGLTAAMGAKEAMVAAERAKHLPQLFVAGEAAISVAPGRETFANPFLDDPLNSNHAAAALGVRAPLNVHQTLARVDRAELELAKLEAEHAALKVLVDLEVSRAHRELRRYAATVEARRDARQLAQEWRQSEEIAFDLEPSNAKDVIDAIEAELTRRAAYFQAVFEYNVAAAKLRQMVGGF